MGGGGQQQFAPGQGGAPNFTPVPNQDQSAFMQQFTPSGGVNNQYSPAGSMASTEPGMMPALQRLRLASDQGRPFGIGLASDQVGQGGLFDPSTIGVPSQLPPGSNTGGGTFNRDLWNFQPDMRNRNIPFFHAPPLYPGKVF